MAFLDGITRAKLPAGFSPGEIVRTTSFPAFNTDGFAFTTDLPATRVAFSRGRSHPDGPPEHPDIRTASLRDLNAKLRAQVSHSGGGSADGE